MPKFDIYIQDTEQSDAAYYATIECATEDEANNVASNIQDRVFNGEL